MRDVTQRLSGNILSPSKGHVLSPSKGHVMSLSKGHVLSLSKGHVLSSSKGHHRRLPGPHFRWRGPADKYLVHLFRPN
jgi:hypothetical protein